MNRGGREVDIPRRSVAVPPWPRRGYSVEPERRRYRPAKSDILAFCAGAAAVADHAVKAPRPKAVEGKRSLPEDGLALALLIRATHGGMAFDVSLIKNYVSPRQRPTMPRRTPRRREIRRPRGRGFKRSGPAGTAAPRGRPATSGSRRARSRSV